MTFSTFQGSAEPAGGGEAQTGTGPREHVQLPQAAVGLGVGGALLHTRPVPLSGLFGGKGGGSSSAKGPRSRVGLEATESEGWEASSTSSK